MRSPRPTRPASLLPSHDTSDLSCGYDALDEWLKRTALRSEGRTARTYVVCEGSSVIGYYCLATGSIARTAAPGRLRRNAPDPIPVIVIGRLAVTRRWAKSGIGSGMLQDAFRRVLQLSESIGCAAILVHAMDEQAVSFYARYGFTEFPDGSGTLFLPVDTLRAALA